MKKKMIALLAACSMLCCVPGTISLASESTENESEVKEEVMIDNFRGYSWGTSKTEIESSEIKDDMVENIDYSYIDGNTIVFTGSVAGYSAYVYYIFDESDKLVRGYYILQEKHTNKTDYYDDFCNLADLYAEKYGDPVVDIENWKDDLYKDDPSKWGLAIATGKVNFIKTWVDSGNNRVYMIISGDNYEIQTGITYEFAEYEEPKNVDGI